MIFRFDKYNQFKIHYISFPDTEPLFFMKVFLVYYFAVKNQIWKKRKIVVYCRLFNYNPQ